MIAKPIRMQNDSERNGDNENRTSVITRTKPKTKKPNLYRVLLL
ncbi:ATP-dependent Clp protease adaptor ClpS, partial [Rhizobium ruizarguesonis]